MVYNNNYAFYQWVSKDAAATARCSATTTARNETNRKRATAKSAATIKDAIPSDSGK